MFPCGVFRIENAFVLGGFASVNGTTFPRERRILLLVEFGAFGRRGAKFFFADKLDDRAAAALVNFSDYSVFHWGFGRAVNGIALFDWFALADELLAAVGLAVELHHLAWGALDFLGGFARRAWGGFYGYCKSPCNLNIIY